MMWPMNKAILHWLVFVLLLLGTGQSRAANTIEDRGLRHTGTDDDSIDENQVRHDENRRKLWSLSNKEWTRYKQLMQGIRGSVSPANVSPIEVLGVHAKTDQERRKYAEIWAKMMREDLDKTIAFQTAYDEANVRLYPEQTVFPAVAETKPEIFKTGDRVLAFIKIKDCPGCLQIIQRLVREESIKKLSLDIYFIDTRTKKDNSSIRQWAKDQKIDKERLKKGKITLNHDKGNLYKITKNLASKVPLVFVLNKKKITKIQY